MVKEIESKYCKSLYVQPLFLLFDNDLSDESGNCTRKQHPDRLRDIISNQTKIFWEVEYRIRINKGEKLPSRRFYQHVVRRHGDLKDLGAKEIQDLEAKLQPPAFFHDSSETVIGGQEHELNIQGYSKHEFANNSAPVESHLYLPRFISKWDRADKFVDLVEEVEATVRQRPKQSFGLSRIYTHKDTIVGKNEFIDFEDLSDERKSGSGILWPAGYRAHYLKKHKDHAILKSLQTMVTKRFFQHIVRRAGKKRGMASAEIK